MAVARAHASAVRRELLPIGGGQITLFFFISVGAPWRDGGIRAADTKRRYVVGAGAVASAVRSFSAFGDVCLFVCFCFLFFPRSGLSRVTRVLFFCYY